VIKAENVALALRNGLFFTCALCEKYWEGIDRGLNGCGKVNCGSPIKGNEFEDYIGPLSELRSKCFVCGNQSDFGVTVRGKWKIIGVCKSHVDLIKKLSPVMERADILQ
jgi:hypothetical protein